MCSQQRRVLYLALVRSIFEHCSPVWAPQTQGALDMIDVIQRRAVKWICKEPFVSYSDNEFLLKQKSLDLLPIKYKFIASDLVIFHKIVYEAVDIKMPTYIVNLRPSEITKPTRMTKCVADKSDTFILSYITFILYLQYTSIIFIHIVFIVNTYNFISTVF